MCFNFFSVLFVRKEYKGLVTQKDINHEKIHTAQIREMLYIFFYLWYGIEWLIRLCKWKNKRDAYFHISLEREAYSMQYIDDYTKTRKHYAFLKYMK